MDFQRRSSLQFDIGDLLICSIRWTDIINFVAVIIDIDETKLYKILILNDEISILNDKTNPKTARHRTYKSTYNELYNKIMNKDGYYKWIIQKAKRR